MMPARRPDSWLILSGSPELRNIGNTATGGEALAGFVSEGQPATMAAPATAAAPVIAPRTVAVSAAPVVTPVLRYATTSAKAHQSGGGSRTLSMAATLIVIAAATASAVLVISLGSADQPATNVPPPSQAEAAKHPPLVLAEPTLPPDPQWTVDAVKPEPPPPSSRVAAPTNRAVGTTGRRTPEPNQAARTPRAAGAPYRGSLAIRSTPPGARVLLNGAHVGSTPLVLDNLPVGSRVVRIEADGFEGWSASTRVVANQQTRVSPTLARVKP